MKRKSKVLIVVIPLLFLVVVSFLGYMVAHVERRGEARLFHFGKQIGIIKIKGVIISSSTLIKQIKAFRDNRAIGGVILRINSPGGGVAPSQEICEEIRKLGKRKPVITSMGSVCASGGYYIASSTSTIFANPGTVTGSIGVIVEFSNLTGLFKKIGVKSYVIKSGKFKDIGYPTRDMTPEDFKVIQGVVDSIFHQFVKAVSEGRHLPFEKVRALADGRVFSGAQAKELGLVDRLGNLEDAIAYMAKRLGVRGKPQVVYAPQPGKKLWQILFKSALGKWGHAFFSSVSLSPFYYLWPLTPGF